MSDTPNTALAEVAVDVTESRMLVAAAENHFDVNPDDVNWGHVTKQVTIAASLKIICNIAFNTGDCAPDA